MSNPVKHLIDGAALTTVLYNIVGIISGAASVLAGLATLVWAVLRLYEMETVQIRLPEKYRLSRFKSQ